MPEKTELKKATLEDLIKNMESRQSKEEGEAQTKTVFLSEIDATVVIEIPKESEMFDIINNATSDEEVVYTYLVEPSLKGSEAQKATGEALGNIVKKFFSFRTIQKLSREILNASEVAKHETELVEDIKKL